MNLRPLLAAALTLTVFESSAAQFGDQQVFIAFDYSEIDTRKDEHRFEGNVRITQGEMFITSDQATAQGAFQSDDSRWTFERNVHLHTPEVDLRADTVVANIVKGAIAHAIAKGSPATFEQRNAAPDKQVEGRAGQIDYDLVKGVVRLSEDVWFSYGGNEFRGAVVVYDVRDERVVVNPDGSHQGRVNITIRPRADADSQDGADSGSAPPAQQRAPSQSAPPGSESPENAP